MTDYPTGEFEQQEYDERVIEIGRVAKVVSGGRRFSFRVTVVVGDNKGSVGIGVGKANTVPDAMRKASEKAHRNLHKVWLYGRTIPHEVTGRVSGAEVLLKPASPGTGVIAAGGVRAVLEAVAISDILTKSLRSSNVLNVVYAGNRPMSELIRPLRRYASSGEINFKVDNKEAKMEELARRYSEGQIDHLDGVTISFKEWWFNCRPSNTEPLLRLNIEAKTEDLLKEKLAEMKQMLGAPV